MAGKTKATTRKKKGGQKSKAEAKTKKDAELEELDDIFGAVEEEDAPTPEEEELEDEVVITGDHEEFSPTITEVDDDEVVEEEEEEEEPTQAAEEEEEEETTPSDEAGLIELLPEKFRGEDLAESIKKLSSSYGESESKGDSLKQELAQAAKILRGISGPPAPQQTVQKTEPTEGIPDVISPEEEDALAKIFSDIDILEDPITPFKKLYAALKIRMAMERQRELMQYDSMRTYRDEFDRFKAGHTDFDDYKSEMLEILKVNPHLDNPQSVELVYNKAKELRAMRAETVKKETTESVLGSDQLKELLAQVRKEAAEETANKVREELLKKLKQGEAVKGALSSTSAPSPTPRDRTRGPEGRKLYRIKTDHGDRLIDDEEVAGIIAAEQYEAPDLLNL